MVDIDNVLYFLDTNKEHYKTYYTEIVSYIYYCKMRNEELFISTMEEIINRYGTSVDCHYMLLCFYNRTISTATKSTSCSSPR